MVDYSPEKAGVGFCPGDGCNCLLNWFSSNVRAWKAPTLLEIPLVFILAGRLCVGPKPGDELTLISYAALWLDQSDKTANSSSFGK